MVGKTNMDQFAAGLVGTRSPYGCPRNPFDDRFLPGGSSSGSGAAVGAGLVCFALGTDTAGSGARPLRQTCELREQTRGAVPSEASTTPPSGPSSSHLIPWAAARRIPRYGGDRGAWRRPVPVSACAGPRAGRVPAHFCGCVGIKPTVGRTSTEGVIPACRSLDCVSVFARSVPDAAVVVRIMQARRAPGPRPPPPPPAPLATRGSGPGLLCPGPPLADLASHAVGRRASRGARAGRHGSRCTPVAVGAARRAPAAASGRLRRAERAGRGRAAGGPDLARAAAAAVHRPAAHQLPAVAAQHARAHLPGARRAARAGHAAGPRLRAAPGHAARRRARLPLRRARAGVRGLRRPGRRRLCGGCAARPARGGRPRRRAAAPPRRMLQPPTA